MEFNQKIIEFQNGQNNLDEEIYELAKTPFTKSNISFYSDDSSSLRQVEQFRLPREKTSEMFIAVKIRALREKWARPGKSARSGCAQEFKTIVEYLRPLMRNFKPPIKYSSWYLEEIKQRQDEICAYLFENEVKSFIQSLDSLIDANKCVEEAKQPYYEQFDEWCFPALQYALKKVDPSRTTKEMVSYINKVLITKFIEIQIKDRKLKRIRQDGMTTYQKPFIHEDTHFYIFENDTDFLIDYMKLTKSQKEFYNKLTNLINKEVKNQNRDAFKFGLSGKSYLNKRYFAGLMKISESSFKHRLKRLKNKSKSAVKEYANALIAKRKNITF